MEEYLTVRQVGTDAFVEKKSRFIGSCAPVQTEAAAMAFIEEVKKAHGEANHNVWAFVLRDGSMRFSDDGEPQGKAGIPVLDAVKKSGVVDVAVVATRYFGGILLGGGGLIRAYSHTASIAIASAQKVTMKNCLVMELTCDYDVYGKVELLLPAGGAHVEAVTFLEKVTLSYYLEPGLQPALARQLADASNGRVVLKELGKRFCPQ